MHCSGISQLTTIKTQLLYIFVHLQWNLHKQCSRIGPLRAYKGRQGQTCSRGPPLEIDTTIFQLTDILNSLLFSVSIALRIFLSIPFTVAEGERSLSKLSRLLPRGIWESEKGHFGCL